MLTTRAEVFTALGIETTATDQDRRIFQLVHRPAEAALTSFLNISRNAAFSQHVEYLPFNVPRDRDLDMGIADVDRVGDTVHLLPFGPAPRTLQLKHRPVWAESIEVREDTAANAGAATGAFADETILTYGTDYWLDNTADLPVDGTLTPLSETGLLTRATSWPTEARSVKITYMGGHRLADLGDQLANIKYAAILTVMTAFRTIEEIQGGSDGASSESIGKYSVSKGGSAAATYSTTTFTVPPEAQRLAMPVRNMRLWG